METNTYLILKETKLFALFSLKKASLLSFL